MSVRAVISTLFLVALKVIFVLQPAYAELYQQPVRQSQSTFDPRLAGLIQDTEELRYRLGQMKLDNEVLKKYIDEFKQSLVDVKNEQKKLAMAIKSMDKEWRALNQAQIKDIIAQMIQQIQK